MSLNKALFITDDKFFFLKVTANDYYLTQIVVFTLGLYKHRSKVDFWQLNN